MRRLPIYFLIDVSESMVGEPIEQVQQGMRTIIQQLRTDPYALETAWISILAFAGKAQVLSPLEEVYKFYPPTFPVGSGTSLGAGLELLMSRLDADLQRTTADTKGDWKPIIFLFTDGNPTDNYAAAVARWQQRYRGHCNLVAVALGDNVDTQLLGQLTENVLRLAETDAQTLTSFFRWVTASIRTSSMSVSEQGTDRLELPDTEGTPLERVETGDITPDNPELPELAPDDNFVVLRARCQAKKRDYLIKYGRRTMDIKGVELFKPTDYKLVGAFPIDAESYEALSIPAKELRIGADELVGAPSCPVCGNMYGFVKCSHCGRLFCAGDDGEANCPWCGTQGTLNFGGGDSFDVTRSLG